MSDVKSNELSQENPAEYSEARVVEESPEAGNETADEIRTQIEETRAELTETIDALQDKLDPRRVKAKVQDATLGRVQELAHNASEKIGPASEKAIESAKKLSEAAKPAAKSARMKGLQLFEKAKGKPLIAVGVAAAIAILGWGIRRKRHSF